MKRLLPIVLGAFSMAFWVPSAFAQDDNRPVLFHTPPRQTVAREPLSVEGLLIDGKRIDKVFLRYRPHGEAYRTVEMEVQYGEVYRGTIPGNRVTPPSVEYYIQGTTFDGKSVLLYQSEKKPIKVKVVLESPSAPPPEPPPPTPPPVVETAPPAPAPEPPPKAEPPPVPAPEPGPAPESPPPAATAEPPRAEPPPAAPVVTEPARARPPAAQEPATVDGPDLRAVLTRAQLRANGARTVAEALDFLPGLTITRDVSGFYRPGVRGIRSDAEVQLRINGKPINDPYDGRALWELPVHNLERLEVTRGPGAGGFLATVNLVTDPSEGARGAVSGGTSTTLDAHGTGAWSIGVFRVSGDVDVGLSDGVAEPVPHDSLDRERDAQGYRADPSEPVGTTQDELFLLNAGLSAAYTHPTIGQFNVSARVLAEGRNALIGAFDTLGRGSSLTSQAIFADVTYERTLGSFARLTARAHLSDHRGDRTYLLSPPMRGDDPATNPATYCSRSLPLGGCAPGHVFPEGMQELQRFATLDWGGEAYVSLQLAQSNALQAGVRASRILVYSHALQTNFDLSLSAVSASAKDGLAWPWLGGPGIWGRTTAQVWAQDTWRLLPQLTVLTAISAGLTTLPDPNTLPTGVTGLSVSPEIGPRVAVRFAPLPVLTLSASYARAIRPPTMAEFSFSLPHVSPYLGRFVGNPLLQSSSLDAVEASAEWLHVQGEARVHLRATGFFERFASPIVALDTSGDLPPFTNRLGTQVYGVEGEARLETGSRANAWANASWFRAVDLATPPAFQLLTELPQARLNAGLSVPIWDYLDLDLAVQVGSERRSDARAGLEILHRWRLPAYSSVTAQLRTPVIAGRFTAALSVHDALDEDRADDAPRMDRVTGGVPRGGRTIFATLTGSL